MIRTTAYQERLDALSTGAEGERLAAEYLLKEGFDLLHRSLCKAARGYIATYGLDMDVQFDFIGVEFDADGTHTLRYLPDAMAPRW